MAGGLLCVGWPDGAAESHLGTGTVVLNFSRSMTDLSNDRPTGRRWLMERSHPATTCRGLGTLQWLCPSLRDLRPAAELTMPPRAWPSAHKPQRSLTAGKGNVYV